MWQFPNRGSNPRPLQWKCGVLTTGPPEKSLQVILKCTVIWEPLPESVFSFGKSFEMFMGETIPKSSEKRGLTCSHPFPHRGCHESHGDLVWPHSMPMSILPSMALDPTRTFQNYHCYLSILFHGWPLPSFRFYDLMRWQGILKTSL